MALPLSFFTPSSDRETSRDTSKNGSGCEEEDFRLCNGASSTVDAQSPNVSQVSANAASISEHNPDLGSKDSASKVRIRKRRDRPLSLTKSGVARKGRKTYTERDLVSPSYYSFVIY
ncbi:hypothetical protein OSTOST_22550 [Ostertagia ostertagi]